MARAMWIDHCHVQVGVVEWEVVVAAIPDNYITAVRIVLSLSKDGLIVYAGVDDVAAHNVGFVFLYLFDGASVLFQIGHSGKSLHLLGGKVSIGHGMPDGHDL